MLALLVVLAYGNSFSAGFVFDNKVLILEDPRLKAVNTEDLFHIVQRSYWWPYAETSLYRPATTLSYLVNYTVLGHADRPAGYHAVNLLLHVANSWLLFALFRRLAVGMGPAFCAAAVWAVHPLGSEATTNIVGRADLLAALGVMGGLYSHLRAREAHSAARAGWLGGLAVMSGLAASSKESGVTIVGVIVLYDLLFRAGRTKSAILAGWLATAVPVLLYLGQRATVLGVATTQQFPFVDNPILGASFWRGRLTALTVVWRYVTLVVWPSRLSADYSFPQIPLATGTALEWAAALAVVGGVAIGATMFWRNRTVAFLLAASAMTFLPASNLLFPTGTIMAERLIYLPSALLMGALIPAVYAGARVTSIRGFAPAVMSIVIVALGIRTVVRNRDWRDELTLWTATAAASPRSFKSHGALAEALYDADASRSNLDRVIAEKEISLSLLEGTPDPAETSEPYREAATYYLERGEWLENHGGPPPDAAAAYERAAALSERYLALLALRPTSQNDRNEGALLVAAAYQHLKNGDKAVTAARSARTGDPFNPVVWRSSAAALLTAEHRDEAAIELMTGFMVTGQADLRTALIELYRSGLDANGCAVTPGPGGVVLNSGCEVVRRHLCAAAVAAIAIQHNAGRSDLAGQLELSTRATCGPTAIAGRP